MTTRAVRTARLLALACAIAAGATSVDSQAPVPGPTPAARIVTLKDIRRTILPDVVRVTIELDGEVPFHDERIANPDRVFVDFPSTRSVPALIDQTIRFDGDDDVVRQVRIGRQLNRTTRVVLDTIGVSNYSVYSLYDPYRLVIDCVRVRREEQPGTDLGRSLSPTPPAPRVLASRTLVKGRGELARIVSPETTGLREARAAGMASGPGGTPAPLPPAVNPITSAGLPGSFSIARQLGLTVSRIVIDPGHGGHDPGAKGKNLTEAKLVLDVALRLEKLLAKIPGVQVILTRRGDDFVPLEERTAIANRESADLFLSIHANASANPTARGVETYFLNFANSMTAAAVAARENAASGQAMAALPDFVKAIALNNKLDESREFASLVQRSLVERLRGSNKRVKDLGVKQAPFVVLIGAAMPSVLAEVSFVTNVQEASLMRGAAYRQRIAEALLTAVQKYQTSLGSAITVARQ